MMRAFLFLGTLAWALVFQPATQASSQTFPDRTIKIIVPVAAGGLSDSIARLFGEYLESKSKQTVVVENKPGAGGNLGFELLANSAPDGYTLGLATSGNIVINPYLYKMNFNPRDLVPVAPIGHAPILIFVNDNVKAKSFSEFIELAKSNPNKITYGSSGVGTTLHLTFETVARMAGVKLTHVPYRGATPALTDLVAGHIDSLAVSIGLPLPFVQAGKVRALAITAKERAEQLPDVPTLSEVGLPSFEATTWFALFAPKGTPEHVADYLNDAVRDMLKDKKVVAFLSKRHIVPMSMDRKEFSEFLREDDVKWRGIVKESGIKPK